MTSSALFSPVALSSWLRALRPSPLAVDLRERWRIVCGVGLGLLVTALVSHLLDGPGGGAWLVAPLGASAVLVFGVPSSPLAQPWSVVGGNTLSALVGIAFVKAMPVLAAPLPVVVGLACGAAVGVMILTRCLHPPGGAAALLVVLGGVADWRFALFPVLVNSLLLVTAGMAWNSATGRRYPHRPSPPAPTDAAQRFDDADLDEVIARYNQVLEVPRDDLRQLLEGASLASRRRRLGATSAGDIMSTTAATVAFGTALADAWRLLRDPAVDALPVIDGGRRVIGMLTRADFLRQVEPDQHGGLQDRLRRLILATPGVHSDKPEVVGQIMSAEVRTAGVDWPLAELLPLVTASAATAGIQPTVHRHVPVVDASGRFAGLVGQTDVLTALARLH